MDAIPPDPEGAMVGPRLSPAATGSLHIFSVLGDPRRDSAYPGDERMPQQSSWAGSMRPEAPEEATPGVVVGSLLKQLGIHPGKPAPHYRRQHWAIPWPGSDSG